MLHAVTNLFCIYFYSLILCLLQYFYTPWGTSVYTSWCCVEFLSQPWTSKWLSRTFTYLNNHTSIIENIIVIWVQFMYWSCISSTCDIGLNRSAPYTMILALRRNFSIIDSFWGKKSLFGAEPSFNCAIHVYLMHIMPYYTYHTLRCGSK